jgi:acylpyruvate hydrolase
MKPPSTYIKNGEAIEIPLGCQEIHHEIELGIVIGSTCKRVQPSDSMKHVGGYVLALDMTARDFQNDLKAKGHPWELAKCFDTSCPISDFISKDVITDPQNVELVCKVNGELRQQDNTSKMICRIPDLISYISQYFTLEEGDMILTGTPAGVGPVKDGDIIEGEIPGIVHFKFPVVQRK